MAEPRRLTELVRQTLAVAEYPDGPSLVALSGGADSAALLMLAIRSGLEVRAVHVHHGLPASDRLEDAARAIAAELNVDLVARRVEVEAVSSFEAVARTARYEALASVAEGDEWILTGHTQDDQAETFLDHLLRRSGLDGLRGIAQRRGRLWRPLLGVSRSQTRELATLAGLLWIDDPSNLEPDPLRNRLRRELIPHLESSFNPRLRESLAATAALVAGEVEFLDRHAAIGVTVTDTEASVPASLLTTVADPLASRRARRLLAGFGNAPPSRHQIESVLAVAKGETDSIEVSGLHIYRRRASVVVSAVGGSVWDPVALAIPGETRIGGWVFDAYISERPPPAMPLGAGWMVADGDGVGALTVEPAAVHPQLTKALVGAGVGADERDRFPVVANEEGPVWLPGVQRLGVGWAEADTRRYLIVRMRESCHRSRP